MSATLTALRRLAAPGVAAATLVAGLPLLTGTAAAAPVGSVTLTPVDGDLTGAAGTCQAFYVDAAPASSTGSTVGEKVNVVLTDPAPGSGAVAFCTVAQDGVAPQSGTVISPTQRSFVLSDRGSGSADARRTGRVVVGVTRSAPTGTSAAPASQQVSVQAYVDTNGDNSFNAGEATDSRSLRFTAGGPAGSNENQDAAAFVEVLSAADRAATPPVRTANGDADSAVAGETRTFRVLVTNGNATGDELAGVTVSVVVTSTASGAAQPVRSFAVTDNDGVATGTVTFPARSGTTTTTDTVTFFVNQTRGGTPGLDSAEPRDAVAVAVQSSVAQQNRTVDLTPATRSQQVTDRDADFTAVVDDPRAAGTADSSTAGTLLAFSISGGSGDERVVVASGQRSPGGTPNECTTVNHTATSDGNDSSCTVTVVDPTPTVGQTLTVTATVRGTDQADASTLTFTNSPADARNITLTPESATTAPNTARTFTATVLDSQGNPVAGVTVRFTEEGAGAFRNGASQLDATTNDRGQATVETVSLPGETGQQTLTATILAPRSSGAGNDQCEQAAGQGRTPQGGAVPSTQPAGNCTATATNTFSTGSTTPPPSPSPSPTPTASTPPGSGPCAVPASIALDRDTIIATGSAQITVRATADSVVDVYAYSRPSTTYRLVRSLELGSDGVATDRIVPPTNTRLYAQQRGCTADPARSSVVLNVRTLITLFAERNGTRDYTFSGRALPARPGGLIVSLYRLTDDGRQVLTAQTRADASTGRYVIERRFTGTGRFGFVVRTGQDLQNAPGSSNVRSLLVF